MKHTSPNSVAFIAEGNTGVVLVVLLQLLHCEAVVCPPEPLHAQTHEAEVIQVLGIGYYKLQLQAVPLPIECTAIFSPWSSRTQTASCLHCHVGSVLRPHTRTRDPTPPVWGTLGLECQLQSSNRHTHVVHAHIIRKTLIGSRIIISKLRQHNYCRPSTINAILMYLQLNYTHAQSL